jgi:hypothetical protein
MMVRGWPSESRPVITNRCASSPLTGNLVPAAFLAALAIESGCEWVTAELDFARFPGLRWRYPLSTGSGGRGTRAHAQFGQQVARLLGMLRLAQHVVTPGD